MRLKYLVPGVAVALIAVPSVLAAPKKPNPQQPQGGAPVTLDAKPSTVVFSAPAVLSGRLGAGAGGVAIRLEQDTSRPYGDGYQPAGQAATTAGNGAYSFSVKPLVNTQYRVTAESSPPVTSAPKLVLVRTLVGLTVSDSTPARGRLVRFSGSVYPAHDGRSALVQKRSPSGRFVTVARAMLRDAGDARSSYSRRIRIYRDGVYRVKLAGDSDHINGFSRLRTIRVG